MKKIFKKHRTSLALVFSIMVFVILVCAILLAVATVYILIRTGVIGGVDQAMTAGHAVLIMALISIVLGSVFAFFGSRIPLKPLNALIDKLNRLAEGDFKARLQSNRSLDNYPAATEVINSFNKLAAELENTELLRSDFINNFSHEFKTPIVSIAGFARLLGRDNISEEQKKQYISAIEEESMRLSYMATNVLNLTKIENQTILTDLCRFNLSEQVRAALLLLEDEWSKKDIDLQLCFDEHYVEANEELLKQVWINLIDNAVKFSPCGGTVTIDIRDIGETVMICIANSGEDIPEGKQDKVFNKFYQADDSHTTRGNGIGLAIVKRITELHGGTVGLSSQGGITTFTVELPKRQTAN